ncbi:MAG: VanZ family protein [Bacteroidales bacterium]|jgi:hypothetical protein|nr:VanZ family protein [Bacteroidales bacterium]
MNKIIQWLGKNKVLAVLAGFALYLFIVAFHDEVTDLVIKMRNAIGTDTFNKFLAYIFLVILIIVLLILFYQSLKDGQKLLKISLSVIATSMMVISFRLLMVYNIEAIHFIEYMLVAMIFFPVIRNYGETVFWVTILGMLDELFQYRFLTPDFGYFDFNDVTLNLLGAGTGMVIIFTAGARGLELRRIKWYRSPAFLTGTGLLAIFIILVMLQKISMNPVDTAGTWYSINRESLPDEFWTEAYPGRRFHILRPTEGIILMIMLLTGFSILDLSFKPQRRSKDFTKSHKV